MLKYLKKMKGQSTMEYAILIIIIIGALVSIQVYIKRGIQGRLKSAADDIGDQYSPGNTNVTIRTKVSSRSRETYNQGVTASTLLGNEVTNIFTNQKIDKVNQEYWGGI